MNRSRRIIHDESFTTKLIDNRLNTCGACSEFVQFVTISLSYTVGRGTAESRERKLVRDDPKMIKRLSEDDQRDDLRRSEMIKDYDQRLSKMINDYLIRDSAYSTDMSDCFSATWRYTCRGTGGYTAALGSPHPPKNRSYRSRRSSSRRPDRSRR